MALAGSERDAKDALSKLLQLGTVEDYQREFEMLIKRVTIPESLLKSFYISGLKLDLQCLLLRSNPKTLDEAFSLARAAETRFANLDIWEFLRSNPSTLGEDFFKDRVTEACFEIIAKEDKEHIVEKKIDVLLPLKEVVGGGEALGIGEDDDLGDATTDGGDDAVESGDISILNSLIGHGSPRSLQLWGKIGKGDVHVLIDNGSTHNFIRPDVVEKLCLPTHFTKVFKVYIGRGETLLCENMCAHVASEIQDLCRKVDLYVLMMKGMLRRQQQQQIVTNAKIQRRLRRTTGVEDGIAIGLGFGIPESREFFKTTP
ncbi:retrovirus-related pol polyprotein from transposon 297 family protein [Tanacetum coccineum]